MQTYGLLGKNIAYSLSPAMHNAAFKELGLAAEYKIFDIDENETEEFFSKVRAGEISGSNVTIPYKEKALDFLEGLSPAAKAIGAVNTIVRGEGVLTGHNTDYKAFMKSLRGLGEGDLAFEPEEKAAFIFGSGGAAKAVSYGLLLLGVKKIALTDVDIEKADFLAGRMAEKQEGSAVITVAHDERQISELISRSDLLVNATPCGQNPGDRPLFDYKTLDSHLAVFDLVYSVETPLVKQARSRGAKAATGLNMLIYQAARSFELWTGKDAPVEVMRKALLESMER